jgi:hypothetical protein
MMETKNAKKIEKMKSQKLKTMKNLSCGKKLRKKITFSGKFEQFSTTNRPEKDIQ